MHSAASNTKIAEAGQRVVTYKKDCWKNIEKYVQPFNLKCNSQWNVIVSRYVQINTLEQQFSL